jgi:hypothetical protein
VTDVEVDEVDEVERNGTDKVLGRRRSVGVS